ncbi:MAG: DUF2934 domain-containing protein [Aestuariivirga sp.]
MKTADDTQNTSIERDEQPTSKTGDTVEINLEERKRMIAYQLWEEEGRPEGKAEEHWNRACLMVASLERNEGDERLAEGSPEWLRRQRAETVEPAGRAKQASAAAPSEAPPAVEAPLDAIRRRIAERKTA